MYQFEKNDDGCQVFDADGRCVCHVGCATTTGETSFEKDPKHPLGFRPTGMKYGREIHPWEKWTLKFTGRPILVDDLAVLLRQLAEIKE